MVAIRSEIFLALGLTITAAFLNACSPVEHRNQDASRTTTLSIVQKDALAETKILETDPDGCTWVAATGSVRFGDQDTKHQAYAQAIAEARRKAIDTLLGVRIDHRFMDFQGENTLRGEFVLTEKLLRATQLGRAVKENVLYVGPVDDPGCIACRVEARIQTCLVPERERGDKDFHVHLQLNRSSYQNGDEVIISATSTRDCYLYFYNVDMDFRAALIAPNKYVPSVTVKAGEVWVYPSDDLRTKGLRATAQLLPGSSVSAETVRVVASKAALPSSLVSLTTQGETTRPSFFEFLRALISTDVEWVEDVQAFTIRQH
ncbi:MAG TPA: DUF4384 domain-containing protein [Nitrospiraceae bacterium]|nr:DUF4384 domain-containing protein [Nitrospiraceae bacterium]